MTLEYDDFHSVPGERAREFDPCDVGPPAFSDDALALRFAELHQNDLRYVAAWGRWLIWDGKRWQVDQTMGVLELVRQVCREAAREAPSKIKRTLTSAKTVAAIVNLARSDPRLAATVDQWDADPWLLNTPAGVFDLRKGEQREHKPDDYLTHMTAVAPEGPCPTWQTFLKRVTNGDEELEQFLKRVAGYSLTGRTQEQCLFFLYGTGANGKSVFVSAIAGILADYHRTAPIGTFTDTAVERHPTDLAGLRGARLVTAVETEEGRHWAEARVKQLTGGDKISARFMRQDFFEYEPQFKLMIVGNHKPGLRSVDEAIRRRLHLIPFRVTIPPSERDERLAERLEKEWPGILRWMIEGAREWYEGGLATPKAVADATDSYLEEQDRIAAWIEECCERNSASWAARTELFKSWTDWAAAIKEQVGSRARFYEALEAHGFVPVGKAKARGFRGIRIRQRGNRQGDDGQEDDYPF